MTRMAGVLCIVVLAAWPPGAGATEEQIDCEITNLRVNAKRFYVGCARTGEIRHYSAAYTQENARYVFDVLLEAQRRGKSVRLIYDDDPASNPTGCSARSCRRIIAAELR